MRRNSTARSAALGMTVAELIEKKGLKGVDLKERLGWSDSKVSRMKSGIRSASVVDLAMLLAVLEVKGDERNALIAIAESLGQRNTWLPSTLSRSGDTGFLERVERIATRLTSFSPNNFPIQLRSSEYVNFLANNTSRHFHENLLARFFIGEAAFTRRESLADMTAALLHELLQLSVRPSVQIRLVPDSAAIAADSPSFTQMIFPDYPPVVHIEAMKTSALLEHGAAMDHARTVISSLTQKALTVEATRTRLAALAASVSDTSTPQLADLSGISG